MPVLTKFINPGDKVDISKAHVSGNGDSEGKKQHRTRVYDVVSDDEIKLNMPMDGMKLVLLTVGMEYELCFYTDNGLYQCNAVVRDRYKSNNVFVVTMELTTGLHKFQRREYYRLNCVLDMKCTELDEEERQSFSSPVEFLETDFTMDDGVIVDISGGGVRFVSKVMYEVGTTVLFSFNLGIGTKDVNFKLFGRILMSRPIENRTGDYENRVQFMDVPPEDREAIIRFIFEEERKIRRKEKF